MRRKVRGSSSDRFELNLTPLLDVVLQLITFFMMLVHFGSRIEGQTPSVHLPIAAAALPGADLGLDRLVVAIDREGRLVVADAVLDPVASARWWGDQAKVRRDARKALGGNASELPTTVVLRADKDATYGVVRKALAQAQRSGFARFSLIVLREDQP